MNTFSIHCKDGSSVNEIVMEHVSGNGTQQHKVTMNNSGSAIAHQVTSNLLGSVADSNSVSPHTAIMPSPNEKQPQEDSDEFAKIADEPSKNPFGEKP